MSDSHTGQDGGAGNHTNMRGSYEEEEDGRAANPADMEDVNLCDEESSRPSGSQAVLRSAKSTRAQRKRHQTRKTPRDGDRSRCRDASRLGSERCVLDNICGDLSEQN